MGQIFRAQIIQCRVPDAYPDLSQLRYLWFLYPIYRDRLNPDLPCSTWDDAACPDFFPFPLGTGRHLFAVGS
jgi:hypothetical protein